MHLDPSPLGPTPAELRDAPDEYLEHLCRVSHDAYEAAATEAGWETNPRSRVPWSEVPEENKATMRAAMAAVRREVLRTVYDEIHAECRWQEQQKQRTNHIEVRIWRNDTIKRLTTVWESIKTQTGMLRP